MILASMVFGATVISVAGRLVSVVVITGFVTGFFAKGSGLFGVGLTGVAFAGCFGGVILAISVVGGVTVFLLRRNGST